MKPCYDCGEDTNSTQRKRCLKCFSEHRKKQQKKNKEKYQYHKTPKYRYSAYKKGAIKRNIEFNITFDEFLSIWNKPCMYCGDNIEGIGIDRKDNDKGYIIENILSCCKVCNFMKHTLDDKIFLEKCYKITIKNFRHSPSSKVD